MLRPDKLSDIVGNEDIVKCIKITIESTLKRGDIYPHTLLKGNSGCGKTTIARVLANELGVPLIEVNGASLTSTKNLLPILSRIKCGTLLFADEAHSINPKVSEYLYNVMEDFSLNIGTITEHTKLDFDKFTFVAATTESGKLNAPLLNRFKEVFTLNLYEDNDLAKLILMNGDKLGLRLKSDIALNIARRARGVPRIANAYLEWIHHCVTANNISQITSSYVNEAFALKGIDEEGLTIEDRKYLTVLDNVRVCGLDTLCSSTGFTKSDIVNVIEPMLLRKNKIIITPNGRMSLTNFSLPKASSVPNLDFLQGLVDG